MKLVPYFFTHPPAKQGTLSCLWIFLSFAGKRLWQTEEPGSVSSEEILSSYCEPNGLPIVKIDRQGEIAYLEVDPSSLRFSDFYQWEEALRLPEKPECWKRFVSLQDAEGNEWWSGSGILEAELPELGSVDSVVRSLRKFHG